MKWFWMVMAGLGVAAGVVMLRGVERREGAGDQPELLSTPALSAAAAPPVGVGEVKAEAAKSEGAKVAGVAPASRAQEGVRVEETQGSRPGLSADAAPRPEGGEATDGAASAGEKAANGEGEKAAGEEVERGSADVDSAAAGGESPGGAAVSHGSGSGDGARAAVAETKADEAKPAMFKEEFEVVPARVRAGEDGFTVYDERFPVKGAGTAEDPMQVSWELLVSASETFQPRMGKKRLPERITMLDGRHVRVTGYVAFPIMAASQNELLSMRNMWDGCCIGVPPTPYDAIEVKLAAAATGRERFTAFGVVEGVMKVDPYIKGNWLLGLYLMEEARLSQLKEGADPGKHGGM
jgi:hypothetical protein